MSELLRTRDHLRRVIEENNRYAANTGLESVMAYNEKLQNQLAELDRLIEKGERN
jgi:hypothetical protein